MEIDELFGRILCTRGIMGDNLYPSGESAVATYISETSDENVSAMKFDVQDNRDGLGADWHPSETTQEKATEKIVAEIKSLMGI